MVVKDKLVFQVMMAKIQPYLAVVAYIGIGIFARILMIFTPVLKLISKYLREDF
jgi:hypothetical protein